VDESEREIDEEEERVLSLIPKYYEFYELK